MKYFHCSLIFLAFFLIFDRAQALPAAKLDSPFNLEFKTLESKDGDSVLALAYSYEKNLKKINLQEPDNWLKSFAVDFNTSGNITQNKLENPRNFINSTLAFYSEYATRIPPQHHSVGIRLIELSKITAACVEDESESDQCQQANAIEASLLSGVSAFQRFKLGVDAGYETDQSFTAKQQKISLMAFAHYQSLSQAHNMLGALNLTPALLLSLDQIEPNAKTPRASAGDDSAFYRFSGEISLRMPLATSAKIPLALAFNYRYFRELDPAKMVEEADLDRYSLRTWSLSGSNGLFASYSSGRLPFDLKNEDVVQLGWATYF